MKTLKSNWSMVEKFGNMKRETRQKWDRQRRIPIEVKNHRKIADFKGKISQAVEALRTGKIGVSPRILLTKKVKGGFKLIGLGQVAENFDAAKTIAKGAGYTGVRFINKVHSI